MNIQMQCGGLIMMLFLLYFSLRQKKVGLYSEQLFLKVLIVTIVCVCLDILSIVVIVNHDKIPDILRIVVCKTYIVSLVWVGFCGFVYASMDVYARSKYVKVIHGYCVIVAAASILIYSLPIYYYLEGNVVYTYGPSILTTYVFAVLFVVITLYQAIRYGSRMNPKRKRAVKIWMIVWILAAAVQFLNNQILLVGYASSLGMMILFFELENPEAHLDRKTGAYNSHAQLEYMKQLYEKGESFSVLLISLEDYQKNGAEIGQVDAAMREIVQYLEKIPDVKVFKNVERELTLLFPDEEKMNEGFQKIQKRFQNEWNENLEEEKPIRLNPVYMLMPDCRIAASAEEVFHLFKYFKLQNANLSDGRVICINQEMVERKREKEEMKGTILEAIEEDRVEVFYQPIYSTQEKKFVSAEALVRIRERDGSILPPGRFISVAEEAGLISVLGETVFDKTCRFMKEHEVTKYGIRYIEVNLSVRQCEERNLADIYIEIMDKYKLDPSCINLEITESASIQTKKTLVENMQILIEHGVQFSLDDFGNGESNLNYIVDMPVSIVKFDRDMSQAYFENKKAKFVMEAAMHMIHDMELKIVSEGIETEEQMETIVNLGIDYIQGYYFSKPLPEKEFLEFIRSHNAVA